MAISLSFLFFLCWLASSHAQAPVQAPSPAPSASTNVTGVLDKAGQFSMFIRLIKSTQVADQIDEQMKSSSGQGLTIFAPTDSAFSSLKSGTLNSLSDQQKVELVQSHVVPMALTASQFQTVSNPIRTQAGDDGPLNITSTGTTINVTTGVVNATVAGNAVYSDKQLIVYQVDQVLLPSGIFGSKAKSPAPAPGPVKGGLEPDSKGTSDDGTDSNDAPGERRGNRFVARMAWVGAGAAALAWWV